MTEGYPRGETPTTSVLTEKEQRKRKDNGSSNTGDDSGAEGDREVLGIAAFIGISSERGIDGLGYEKSRELSRLHLET